MGMRVGEIIRLERDDIDFENRECVVFGKGEKERSVYFDARVESICKTTSPAGRIIIPPCLYH